MAIKITLDSFLAVVKRSGLLSEEQLTAALDKFRAADGVVTDAKPFAEFLVRQKQLTVWQAEKVLQGKHKGFFLGRYRLLSLLGKGGMSTVFLAQHTVMKRFCALKVLPAKRVHDASYLGRFHREAQAVAALDHPNIVRAYDVDMTADAGVDIHFLAMEFVQGKSLLELIQESGPLSIANAAEYVRQSALGLDHAHKAGLIHRDIKPGNLLVTPTGVLKVLDLGLARFFDDNDHSLTVQHDEKVLGTADYISPEQAIDSHKVDRRTDIYSLGCTLYFLLSGHPPFNSGSLAQRLVAHQTRPAPPITNDRPEVPVELQAIMEKMMAKKAEDRYQTAQEVADAVAHWQKPSPAKVAAAAPVTPIVAVASPAKSAPVPAPAAVKPSSTVAKVPRAKTPLTATPPSAPSVAAKATSAPKKSAGSGVGSVAAKPAKVAPAPLEFALDSSGVDDDDPLGNFLSGGLSGVTDGQSGVAESGGPDFSALESPTPSDSQASRSSSKALQQAAVDTAKINDSQTEVVVVAPPVPPLPLVEDLDLDFGLLDQVFDPALLDFELESPATEEPTAPATPEEPVVIDTSDPPSANDSFDPLSEFADFSETDFTSAPSPPAVPKVVVISAKPAWQQIKPKWLAAGVGGLVVLILALWFMPQGDSKSPAIVPVPVAMKPRPSGELEVIEVGPQGHFATIQEAIDFLRKSFRPLSSFEQRTIKVAGGATYPESIRIVSGGKTQFPRFVTIRSDGPTPAILQGSGTQPVLYLQEVESLTVEGFVFDAMAADVAVEVRGFSPSMQLESLRVQNFKKTGVLLSDVSAQVGEELLIEGLRIQAQAPEGVGLRCQAATGKTTTSLQLKNLRIVGPLKSGIEISGALGKSLLSDTVVAGCSVGIRFTGGLLDEVSLINNTLAKNDRGMVFSNLPAPESRNFKVMHTLFSGNAMSDAVVESGSVAGLAETLLAPGDGRRFNRTDRKEADSQGLDLFTGDGLRGAVTTFASNAADAPNYLKPSTADVKVAVPATGAQGYIGAVAP